MAQFIGSTNKSTKLMLDVTEGSYNINNNTSPVTVKAYLGYSSSNTYMYGANINITVSCTSCSDRSISFYNSGTTYIYTNSWTYLGETTFTVPHNNDGSKSIAISASMSNSVEPSSGSASGSMTLTTIPRASEISSMSNVYIGENTTINVNRKSSSFTHTITYEFGNLGGTIVTKSSSANVPWTIPESFYNEMPNTSQKNIVLYITTYNDNNQVGERKAIAFTLRTRESVCKPDITANFEDINTDTLALTGDDTKLINGHSTVEVSYTATPKKSATISNVTVAGENATSNPYTFIPTTLNAGQNFVVRAIDSRGYTNDKIFINNTDYTFIDYIAPTSSVTLKRKAPTSDELLISFSGNYFNNTFGAVNNELVITWKYREYKQYNPDNWTTGGALLLDTDYVLKGNSYHSGDNADYEEEISLGNLFDYRKDYEVELTITDKLETSSVIKIGLKGIPIINWGKDFFNVNGDIRQYNNPIIDSGSDINGTYVKYFDGTMICSNTVTYQNVAITNTWGSFYESSQLSLGNYPVAFIQEPDLSLTSHYPNFVQKYGDASATSPGTFYASKPKSGTETVKVSYIAIGRWK